MPLNMVCILCNICLRKLAYRRLARNGPPQITSSTVLVSLAQTVQPEYISSSHLPLLHTPLEMMAQPPSSCLTRKHLRFIQGNMSFLRPISQSRNYQLRITERLPFRLLHGGLKGHKITTEDTSSITTDK